MPDHPSVAFLATLFGESGPPKGTYAQLWDLSRSYTHNISSWNQAVAAAAGRKDVYVGVGLSAKKISHKARLRQDECAGIPGCWLDVDVVGGPTNRASGAPDKATAADLTASILEPTLIVDSGYGIQAWWLFPEPWLFGEDDEQRDSARALEAGAVAAHRSRAAWKVDSVHDLARLMRLPGTANGKEKGHPVPVELLHEGPRYEIAALLEAFGSVSSPTAHTNGDSVQLDFELGQAGVDMLKMTAMIAESPRFAAVFEEHAIEQINHQWTASECDLSLASMAAAAGWTDFDIAALIHAHRLACHPDGIGKATRRDYIESTIVRARSGADRDAKRRTRVELVTRETEQREQALAELSEQASAPEPAPEEADSERRRRIELLNEVVFGNATGQRFTRLLQHGRDSDARYTLMTQAGTEVDVGTAKILLNPDRFREALTPAINHVMPMVKRSDWLSALRALVQIAEVVEHVDESPRGVLSRALAAYVQAHDWRGMRTDENEAKLAGLPLLNGEIFKVSITHFLDWAKKRDVVPRNVSTNAVSRDLQALGMIRRKQRAKRPGGGTAQPWYYEGPSDLIDR